MSKETMHICVVVLPSFNLHPCVRLCSRPSLASFPAPHPALCCLRNGIVGTAWYLFSCEHDVIDKWQKKSQWKSKVLRNVQPTTVYDSHPPLPRYVWYVTWYLSSSCCSELQCTHVQLSPFYELSTLDVTDTRKDTRPSAFFMQPETAWAWKWG